MKYEFEFQPGDIVMAAITIGMTNDKAWTRAKVNCVEIHRGYNGRLHHLYSVILENNGRVRSVSSSDAKGLDEFCDGNTEKEKRNDTIRN